MILEEIEGIERLLRERDKYVEDANREGLKEKIKKEGIKHIRDQQYEEKYTFDLHWAVMCKEIIIPLLDNSMHYLERDQFYKFSKGKMESLRYCRGYWQT